MQQVRFLRRNLAGALVLAVASALVLLVPISWWLNRELFRPLKKIIAGADRLAAGELGSRVAVPDAHELATLATGLNQLAGEVETLAAATATGSRLFSGTAFLHLAWKASITTRKE